MHLFVSWKVHTAPKIWKVHRCAFNVRTYAMLRATRDEGRRGGRCGPVVTVKYPNHIINHTKKNKLIITDDQLKWQGKILSLHKIKTKFSPTAFWVQKFRYYWKNDRYRRASFCINSASLGWEQRLAQVRVLHIGQEDVGVRLNVTLDLEGVDSHGGSDHRQNLGGHLHRHTQKKQKHLCTRNYKQLNDGWMDEWMNGWMNTVVRRCEEGRGLQERAKSVGELKTSILSVHAVITTGFPWSHTFRYFVMRQKTLNIIDA